MLFMFLYLSLLSVIDGIPLKKMHSSNLMAEIMSSKDDHKILLNIIADADPEKLNEIVVLVRGLISVSEEELAGLISSSGVADAAYDNVVTTYDTAVSAQTSGLTQLATDLAFAFSIHDQGVVSLQRVVDVAKSAKDVASEAKNTANGVLAADSNRLNSEISTLYQVIALIQGVIGINTVAPTMSPTTEAPTMSPTTHAPTMSPTTQAPTRSPTSGNKINGNFLSLSAESLSALNENDDVSEWKDTSGNGNDFSDSGTKQKCGTPKYGKASWNPSISVVRFGHSGKQTCLTSIISHPVSLSGTYVAVISWTDRSTSWNPIASQSWDRYWMLRFFVDTMELNMHVRNEHMPRVTVALGTPYIVVGRVDDANKMSYMWVWDINANDWLGKAEYSSAGIPTGGNEKIIIGRMDNTIYQNAERDVMNRYLKAEIAQFSMWDQFLSNSEVDNVVQQYIQNG